MTDFYQEMAGVAAELLAPTDDGGLGQGEIVLVQLTPAPPPLNAWEPPGTPTSTRTPLNGAASGVGKALIGTPLDNGTEIIAGDLQVIVAPWDGTASPEDVLALDGQAATVMAVERIPAIGIAAAVRFIVRR